ncbi:MAG: hypothetical protein AUI48_01730 [Chloroflexi bacterium 13_1_40CM_2_68_14]|nr:MAG: hypothetical protein AUI48_01730 [Chloroflexi bacterium 13_1_40CM_2_68_14]
MPRRENVVFFPSAAAAQAAGYRACLRCRPDAAPGSPAQAGTAATLSRALRLLEESGDPSGLAERLGVTDRHLRRLFARHLGASPAEVLRTRRLHLAWQLLENSSLRIIDVAHAAGFHSLRRFNEAVRRGFGRTPSQLRAKPAADAGAELSLRLPFRPPLDFEALLAFFAARALPSIEEVRDGTWRRRLPEGWLEVRRGGPSHLEASMPAALAPRALEIAARIQRVFDLRADPGPILEHLGRDAVLNGAARASDGDRADRAVRRFPDSGPARRGGAAGHAGGAGKRHRPARPERPRRTRAAGWITGPRRGLGGALQSPRHRRLDRAARGAPRAR